MTIHVLIGRTEGFISSVGFSTEGVSFLRSGLHWEGTEARKAAIRELRLLLAHLRQSGNLIIGEEKLNEGENNA